MTDATDLAGLITQRATAGSRYADAIQELHDAYVDLAGIDLAMGNKNVAGPAVRGFPPAGIAALPEVLRHEQYATGSDLPDWRDEVRARGAELVEGIE